MRYETIPVLLLNEFLKEHTKVEDLKSTIVKQEATVAEQRKDFEGAIAQQRQEIQTLTAQLKEQAAQIQKAEFSKDIRNTIR